MRRSRKDLPAGQDVLRYKSPYGPEEEKEGKALKLWDRLEQRLISSNLEQINRREAARERREFEEWARENPEEYRKLQRNRLESRRYSNFALLVLATIFLIIAWCTFGKGFAKLLSVVGAIILAINYIVYLVSTSALQIKTKVLTIITTIISFFVVLQCILFVNGVDFTKLFNVQEYTPNVQEYTPSKLQYITGTVIIEEGIPIKTEPAEDSENILEINIPKDSIIPILERDGEWVKVLLNPVTVGWCRSENGKQVLIETKPTEILIINEGGLNFRSEPSLDSPIIKHLDKNTSCDVIEREERWFKVRVDNEIGWVSIYSPSGSRYVDELIY